MKKLIVLYISLILFGCQMAGAYVPVFRPELSNKCVLDIQQDSCGFIWIATSNGLCRSFGSDYQVYFADPDDPYSIPSNQIRNLYTDKDGRLWMSSPAGVSALDPDSKRFDRYKIESDNKDDRFGAGFIEFGGKLIHVGGDGLYTLNPDENSMNRIVKIDGDAPRSALVGPFGQLWITNGNSLTAIDTTMTVTIRLPFDRENRIETMAIDGNRLLLGTPQGIMRFNPKDLSIKPTALGSDIQVTHIIEFKPGIYLVGTSNRGVLVYNSETGEVGKRIGEYRFDELETDEINKLFVDRDGNIWIATFDKGIICLTGQPMPFNTDRALVNAFRNEFVTRVVFDRNNNLWVGTRYNGLAFYDRRKKALKYLNSETVNGLRQFSNDFVQDVAFDSKGRLWIGYNSSLIVCKPNLNGTEGDNLLQLLKKFSSFTSVVSISEDANGRMWVSTDDNGLYVIDDNFDIIHTISTPVIKSNNITKVIPYDETHMLFSAFDDNIYLVDINNLNVKVFNADIKKEVENAIDLRFDRGHNLWIGTYRNGLFRLDAKTGNLKRCTGASSDDMIAICEDAKGDIWVSSSYGIYRFDPEGNLHNSFLAADGLGGNQFHEKCTALSPDGKVFFGGNSGIEEITPKNNTASTREIPIYLTGAWIMPERTPALTGKLEGRSEHSVEQLTLDYDDNSVNLEFYGINYVNPSKIEYSYMLKGHDDDFIDLETYNRVTYSNLRPGKYDFYVKARFKDGTWQEPVKLLTIKVKPSLWLSPIAIAAYILLFLVLLYLGNISYLRIKLVKQKYDLANERIEHEKRTAAKKINFFTNISHELRTPLTLICGPAKDLKANLDNMTPEQVKESVDFIDTNVNRLLKLINQLLNFRKVDADTLPLQVSPGDIGAQLNEMAATYRMFAADNGLDIKVEIPADCPESVIYDADKIEKITSNLVVNAVKYSKDGGSILIRLDFEKHPAEIADQNDFTYARLSVTDYGKGIDEKDIPKIFMRFRRLLDKSSKTEGFGIGLNYVANLIKEHKGVIKAVKNPGGGMTFTVIFPVSEEAFTQQDSKLSANLQAGISDTNVPLMPQIEIQETKTDDEADLDAEEAAESSLPKILIVEDNSAVNTFIGHLFRDKFLVLSEYDAQGGIKRAVEECPDIIISDIMMPGELDGLDLCREVKTHQPTSHIPVILLTARSLAESQIEGYNAGADAYVSKPFNPEVLIARVNNLYEKRLRQRRQILASAGSTLASGEEEIEGATDLAPLDKKFLAKFYSYIDQSLDNSDLNVNIICRELGFSRTNLYRKIKSLTGISPNDLLRVYRLNRAAELLLTREYTISEVADRTGFSNQSHFSSLFKKHFGVSPRKYVLEHFPSANV